MWRTGSPPSGLAGGPSDLEPILRLDVASQLERVAVHDLIERGSIQLISLEPIRSRLGERWPRRASQVCAHVETVLKRQLPVHDLVLQVDEAHFLIAQTQEQGAAAQAICLRLASDLMTFFLGKASDEDIAVNTVTGFEGDRLRCEPLDVGQLRVASVTQREARAQPRAPTPTPKSRNVAVITRQGRRLDLTVCLEPMWALGDYPRAIGCYARVTLRDEAKLRELSPTARTHLHPSEMLDIDMSVLSEALSLRAAAPRSSGGLLVPISYTGISNSSARYRLLHALEEMDPAERATFAWELVDLEEGLPASRLAEIVGFVRPHCRGVVCRVGVGQQAAEQVRHAGTTASIALDRQPFTKTTLRGLSTPLAALRRVSPAVMLHNLPPNLFVPAQACGATHATLGDAIIRYLDE